MLKVKDWVGYVSAPILLASVGCAVNQRPFAETHRSIPPERMMAMGQAFERQGHYDQAKFAYQQVLAVQPSFPNAQQNLDTLIAKEARLRQQQGDTPNTRPYQMAGDSQQANGNPKRSGPVVLQQTPPESVNPANFVPESPSAPTAAQIPQVNSAPQSNPVQPEAPSQPAPQGIRITPAATPDQIPTTGNPSSQSVKITPYSPPAAPLLESLLSVPVSGELTPSFASAEAENSITLRKPPSPETTFVTKLEAKTVATPITVSPAVLTPSSMASKLSPEVTVASNEERSVTDEFSEVAESGRVLLTTASLDLDEVDDTAGFDESSSTELNSDYKPEIDLAQIAIIELKPYFGELHVGMVEKLKQQREQLEYPLAALAVDAKMPTAIRSRAIFLLGSMGSDAIAVVPVLRRAMHRDGDGYMRVELSEAILKIQPSDEDAVKVLVDCLKETDQDLRWVASLAIRNTSPQQTGFVVDHLKALLQTDDERLKRMIFLTLAEFGTASASAIPELEAALECSDQRTREVAMAALTCVAPERKGVAKVRLTSHHSE